MVPFVHAEGRCRRRPEDAERHARRALPRPSGSSARRPRRRAVRGCRWLPHRAGARRLAGRPGQPVGAEHEGPARLRLLLTGTSATPTAGTSTRTSQKMLDEVEDGERNLPEFDLLVGGFPCQDYSVAKLLHQAHGIQGKKGVLWWQIHRLIEHSRPPFVFLENVDRLLKSPAVQRGRDFAIMLASLSDLGYVVEWRVINAADYGFPQRRRRVFIVGRHVDAQPHSWRRSALPHWRAGASLPRRPAARSTTCSTTARSPTSASQRRPRRIDAIVRPRWQQVTVPERRVHDRPRRLDAARWSLTTKVRASCLATSSKTSRDVPARVLHPRRAAGCLALPQGRQEGGARPQGFRHGVQLQRRAAALP